MIFRKYGTSYQSVQLDFDANALNEIAFRRDRERSIPVDEFDASYAPVESVELATEASGSVQSETEQQMLDHLRARVEEVHARLSDGEVLVVDNEQGHDWPKPRQVTKNVVVEGENRLHFEYTMGPPLRLTVRRAAG
jgi:hypothetical protein